MSFARISADNAMELAGIDLHVRTALARRSLDLRVKLVAEVF
jgi:hypothetical protein